MDQKIQVGHNMSEKGAENLSQFFFNIYKTEFHKSSFSQNKQALKPMILNIFATKKNCFCI